MSMSYFEQAILYQLLSENPKQYEMLDEMVSTQRANLAKQTISKLQKRNAELEIENKALRRRNEELKQMSLL